MKFKFYSFFMFLAAFGFAINANSQCAVGAMTTTGMITVTCESETFDLATDGNSDIPAAGGFGWSFSNQLGGTGGIPSFTLTSANDPATFDSSLNGILPSNNLPNLSGLWVIKAVVYSDAANATATICATSMDSLIVDFLNVEGPGIDDIVDNGDGSATVTVSGGTMPYMYLWSDDQTTATATGLADEVYRVTVTDANGCSTIGEVGIGGAATCQVGTMTTTGNTLVCTTDGTFDVATDSMDVVPLAGGFGWAFDDLLGGSGGLAGGFTIINATSPTTYNADLNGILSSNGLPPLSGLWVVKGVVYDNAMDATGSICSTATDSLIVDFNANAITVDVTDNGDLSATATPTGGVMPYTYAWSNGADTQTADGLTEGETYTVIVTDANGCEGTGSVNIGGGEIPCEEWLNPSPTTGWTDFNSTFGGAPCDDGTGCPFNEITGFQVWASEAYNVEGFQQGGTYTFSMCNGDGAGSWVPEFTIIAPSGAVDAFGLGDGDGCSITWTASESGTYLIVINEAGMCGMSDNTATDNGFPALTCTDGPEVACPEVPCEVGDLVTAGETVVCSEDGTFDVETDGTEEIPTTGGFGWQFSDASGGTGGLAGGFTLTGATNPATYDTDLNGILSSNSLEPLSGIWVVYGVVYENAMNATGSICAATTDSLVIIFSTDLEAVATDNGDGSATASAAGGSPPYSYLWSDGQTTATATGLAGGSYTVVVTDGLGCTVEVTTDVMSSVGEITGLNALNLSPNPTDGRLNLQVQLQNAVELSVEVRNVVGQTVKQRYFGNTTEIAHDFDLSQLADGVYFVRIIAGTDELTRRVVVSK